MAATAEWTAYLDGTGWRLTGQPPTDRNMRMSLRCKTCGQPRTLRITQVLRGAQCSHHASPAKPVTHEQAAAELAGYGFAPVGPYPGLVGAPWRVQCTACGEPRRVCLGTLRAQGQARRCKHNRTSPVTAEQAEQEMRAYGYQPVAPYPGQVWSCWQVRCTTCGAPASVRLAAARNGKRCKHKTNGAQQ